MSTRSLAQGVAASSAPAAPPVVPLKHPQWWIGGAVLVFVAAMILSVLVGNRNLGWPVVAEYFFSPRILEGLRRTIELTVISMVGGVLLGIVLAVMRLSSNPAFAVASTGFVWFFRGVPPLVQLIFWFNLATLVPDLTIGIPFLPPLAGVETNSVMTPYLASVIGLILVEAAYAAEIVRAGIQSVDEGQRNAARSLGMPPFLMFRRIVLPQAMRVIIPPLGNDAVSMLKTTSLVSVIALPELLYSAQMIYAENYQVIPLLLVASIWYLVVTTVLAGAQALIESRLRRGVARADGRTGRGRALSLLDTMRKRTQS